jgi:hypothetical protein
MPATTRKMHKHALLCCVVVVFRCVIIVISHVDMSIRPSVKFDLIYESDPTIMSPCSRHSDFFIDDGLNLVLVEKNPPS